MKTNRKLIAVPFIFASGMPAVSAQQAQRPNILFILTDQQSHNMMSCADNRWLSTPAMDRIAREGYRMERMYCTNPVSMPSRFSLITGRYTTDIGTRVNVTPVKQDKIRERALEVAAESSLGHHFRRAGYRTLYSGKTHLYATRDMTEYGFELHGTDPYDVPAEYAEQFFSEYDGGSPFFLYLSFMNPHDICMEGGFNPRWPDQYRPAERVATQKFIDLHRNLSPEAYRNQIPPPPDNMQPNGEYAKITVGFSGCRDWSAQQWDFYRWMYHRLTEDVDTRIERVLAALDKSGLADNTIVIFTSDHGELNQAHGLVHKSHLLEECQRVPFLAMGPGIVRGTVDSRNLGCGFDLVPTMFDLAGIEVPENLPGVSLKPLLTGVSAELDRKHIVVEADRGYQIHDGTYKYSLFNSGTRAEMLFDIVSDPGEMRDLSDDPAHLAAKERLREKLAENLRKRGLWPVKYKP